MIRVVLEDSDFLIVEKPAGIATQPLPVGANLRVRPDIGGQTHRSAPTLAHILAEKYPELKSVGGSDWGAVHRLDRETSGLVVFARNQQVYHFFREQFSKNLVEREYTALVEGMLAKKGTIDWPIGPDPKSTKRVKVYKNRKEARRNKAQEAMTIYTPLTPVPSPQKSERGEVSLLRVTIKTGRRHQIRAHLAAIGHPVVHLHASRLKFRHPRTNQVVEAAAPIPSSFFEEGK